MQPTNNDNPASPTTVDATIPTGTDAYVTDPGSQPVTSAPVSAAMSDALAATAAASAVTNDLPAASSAPQADLPEPTQSAPIFGPTSAAESIANDPLSPSNNSTAPAVAEPVAEPTSEQSINSSVDALVSEQPETALPTVDSSPPQTAVGAPAVDYSAPAEPATPDSLLAMKQDALQQLSPLVGHLDQTPEEKFKTTMMMLQATDNPALVKEAYEYAKQITDEKSRAQALLDVVNEINYFTHQQNANNQPEVF